MLEEYLDFQVHDNEYDAPALLTILKLYQLNPVRYKADVTAKILLKTLMALPKSDHVLAKCLVSNDKVQLRRRKRS